MYRVAFSLITVQNVCLHASRTHSVSRLCKPSKHLGSMVWIWLLWRCLGGGGSHKYFFGQIRNYLIISRCTAISKSCRAIILKKTQTKEVKMRRHLQDNEGREVGEGIVWNVCDLVEGQRHGLQGRQGV